MKVLFFAQAKLATGCSDFDLPSSGSLTAAEVWDLLEKKFPKLAPLRPSTRLARNCIYASAEDIFTEGDEVALIPPVSGG